MDFYLTNGSEGGAGKRSERLTTAVSVWFGRQGSNSDGEEDVEWSFVFSGILSMTFN